MSSLPQKSIKGAVFKTWAIQSIDKLIDYLSGTFIRGGKGIAVRRSAGVTIIELDKQPEQVQQNATGGGATQDISATTGNNPSIELSGSTSSVHFVGTGDVTISGNTNGQIEIGVSGGTSTTSVGFPDFYGAPLWSMDDETPNPRPPVNFTYAYPVWFMGSSHAYLNSNFARGLRLVLYPDSQSYRLAKTVCYFGIWEGAPAMPSEGIEFSIPFSIAIPANTPFRLEIPNDYELPSHFYYEIRKCV